MKATITHALTIFLAVLVLCVGGGVSFISCYCNGCSLEKVETVTDKSCCKSYNQQPDHDRILATASPQCECEKSGETGCCTLKRIDLEWNKAVNPIFNFQPTAISLMASITLPGISVLYGSDEAESLLLCRSGPPRVVLPRAYLSILTALLI